MNTKRFLCAALGAVCYFAFLQAQVRTEQTFEKGWKFTREDNAEQLLNYLEKNGNCTWKELSAEQKEELEFRVQELQDGLLAAYLSQKYQSGDEAWNEDDLERFFKQLAAE